MYFLSLVCLPWNLHIPVFANFLKNGTSCIHVNQTELWRGRKKLLSHRNWKLFERRWSHWSSLGIWFKITKCCATWTTLVLRLVKTHFCCTVVLRLNKRDTVFFPVKGLHVNKIKTKQNDRNEFQWNVIFLTPSKLKERLLHGFRKPEKDNINIPSWKKGYRPEKSHKFNNCVRALKNKGVRYNYRKVNKTG